MSQARDLADFGSPAEEGTITGENLFVNGGYTVFQRGTSTTGVTTDTYAAPDRWKTRVTDTSEFTISQSTDVPSGEGFSNSCKWDCTTANASPAATSSIIHEQRMEGQNLQHLEFGTSSAKKLTLSFWVKSNKTGTYSYGFYSADGNRHLNATYTISTADTWQKVTKTFDGDTGGTIDNDNGQGLKVWFWLQAGSNFTSGTHETTNWASYSQANAVSSSQVNLADSTSNEWYITGCKLEVGSTATRFKNETYSETLNKCYRYYVRYGAQTSANGLMNINVRTNASAKYGVLHFPTKMRAIPTMIKSSNSHFMLYFAATSSAPTGASYQGGTLLTAEIYWTASGGTAGDGGWVRITNTAGYLDWDAEL